MAHRVSELDFGLHWPVMTSFLSYLFGLPDAACSATNGARIDSERHFFFPLAKGFLFDPSSPPAQISFSGDVRFTGHFGLMSIAIVAPRLELRADHAALTVVDSRSRESRDKRIDLAMIDVRSGGVHMHDRLIWEEMDVELAADGCELFGGVYPVGQRMDPVSIVVPSELRTQILS